MYRGAYPHLKVVCGTALSSSESDVENKYNRCMSSSIDSSCLYSQVDAIKHWVNWSPIDRHIWVWLIKRKFIDENNIRDVYLINDGDSDGINVTIELYNPVELENDNIYTDELSIQIINDGNRVEIAVVNNYESEEEIYENRLGRHEKNNCRKWS